MVSGSFMVTGVYGPRTQDVELEDSNLGKGGI